ncbi:MAG: DUF4126 domain-containing protein [Dysgonamonadaceae bacterium]|nr:DUF4126 domain-containing protein [Dysgonamonadaceae bacterium]MDD3308812.1 DUF4126 domain-containing protein [Dysgonamonadaceae bacterium]MDD3900329.1 DUF4126 domain-containing protein [Dysgonamonadaceae bacterium]MDD4398404.1 DUF4126 domain-containing protein [Dysgonamonadaceae bacterium]
MELNVETISAIALGIGLSASTGFRVFIPLLVAGMAAHFGVLTLGDSFEWLGSIPALVCFGVAAIVEVLAYYVPFVDNLLDSIATPLSIVAGTLLMTSVFPSDNEWMKWIMGFVVGGGTAATVQSGTAIARLTSSQFTGGSANNIVSTTEGIASTGVAVMSLIAPVFIGILIIVLLIIILRYIFKSMHKRKAVLNSKEELKE